MKQLESRLDAMENKLTKVDALIDGLEHLCNSLNDIRDAAKVSGDSINAREDKTGDLNKDEMPGLKDSPGKKNDDKEGGAEVGGDVTIVSIESGGLLGKEIGVTVVFTASVNDCAVEWFPYWIYSSRKRTQGTIAKLQLENNRIQYTCQQTFGDISSLSFLTFTVQCDPDTIEITLNMDVLRKAVKQSIGKIEYTIVDYMPEIRISGDVLAKEGFETTINVTENVVEAIEEGRYSIDLWMTYFNTTDSPVKYETINGYSDIRAQPDFSYSVKDGSDNQIVVRLDKDYAKFGGFLSILLPQNVTDLVCIRTFNYGKIIRVINDDVDGIMPRGIIGLHREQADVSWITDPFMSVYCLAFGNPIPELTVSKQDKDGTTRVVVPSYEIVANSYYRVSVLEFDPKSSTTAGEYLCKASNGQETIEAELIVKQFERVVIIDDDTKVIKKTPKRTVVTCKATGHPVPTLELRKNSRYGYDLATFKFKQYKAKFSTKGNVTRVTVVISPPDKSITSMICLAKQEIDQSEYEYLETKEIVIRP